MNAVDAIRFYILKIVSDPGMKVLLMDSDTVSARGAAEFRIATIE